MQIDPYAGNILIAPLGPILDVTEINTALTYLPAPPPLNIGEIPRHIRMHHLMSIRDLHLPSLEGTRLVNTIDLMMRQSYKYRDPLKPATWASLIDSPSSRSSPKTPAMAAGVNGHSGTGKTEAILRGLSLYPRLVLHDSFPRIQGAHYQVPWLSVDVPSSGRAEHLAASLMMAWDQILESELPTSSPRFTASLQKSKRDGARMLDEWRQVAASHFLGLLHLDEVQNFFHIPTLEKRRQRKSGSNDLELRISEDQCLKWILTLTNTGRIALLFSGTPDGLNALFKRISNVQRIVTSGYHNFGRFTGAEADPFKQVFFPTLLNYQYVKTRIKKDEEDALAELIITLSAGVRRLIIALWIGAHRISFERSQDDSLRLNDFKRAAETFLAPVAPAVAALNTGDPRLMSRYEDLCGDQGFWETFWGQGSS